MLLKKMLRKRLKHKILGVLCAPILLSGCVSKNDDWACVPVFIEDIYILSCVMVTA